MDTAALTLDLESCPYCVEGATDGNETPGDSDSDGVYEFTQDLHHRDRRDSRQPKKKRLRLGKTAANIVRFWRLVCDTFRKIVDSKYFGRGIMIAILINTLSMGIEYHEQVSVLSEMCECVNLTAAAGWRSAEVVCGPESSQWEYIVTHNGESDEA